MAEGIPPSPIPLESEVTLARTAHQPISPLYREPSERTMILIILGMNTEQPLLLRRLPTRAPTTHNSSESSPLLHHARPRLELGRALVVCDV